MGQIFKKTEFCDSSVVEKQIEATVYRLAKSSHDLIELRFVRDVQLRSKAIARKFLLEGKEVPLVDISRSNKPAFCLKQLSSCFANAACGTGNEYY